MARADGSRAAADRPVHTPTVLRRIGTEDELPGQGRALGRQYLSLSEAADAVLDRLREIRQQTRLVAAGGVVECFANDERVSRGNSHSREATLPAQAVRGQDAVYASLAGEPIGLDMSLAHSGLRIRMTMLGEPLAPVSVWRLISM